MIRNIRQTLKRIEILIFVFWKGQQGLGYKNDIGFPSSQNTYKLTNTYRYVPLDLQ